MTDEQIKQRIAEACGWRKEDGVYMWTANGIDCTCPELWDWCNDLNAMHKAEQTLWRKDWNLRYDFVDELGKIMEPTVWHRMNATDMLDATARQRAEAFLRTLGKWEDATDKESLTVQAATTEQSSVDHIGETTEMVEEVQK